MDFTRLGNRAVLVVEGEDRIAFLQGLISNDIKKAAPDRAIWAGFLTPQGKFLYDLFITVLGDSVLLDVEADRLDAFAKRLGMFKLRSKVTIRSASDLSVWAGWGVGVQAAFGLPAEAGSALGILSLTACDTQAADKQPDGCARRGLTNITACDTQAADKQPDGCARVSFADNVTGSLQSRRGPMGVISVDPRLVGAGVRLIMPTDQAVALLQAKGLVESSFAHWDRFRLELGLPDGSRDMEVEGNLLLELGFEELGGVDFKKGCFMGQENTTRSKHRKLIKRRLVQVQIQGETPPPGTPILLDGAEIGQMRSAVDTVGLALVRLEKLKAVHDGAVCGSAKLILRKPDWAIFPDVE